MSGANVTGVEGVSAAAVAATPGAFDLVDVRTPAEFREVHAAGARNVPADRIEAEALSGVASGKRLALICKSGKRATAAAERLAGAGRSGVMIVEGGTDAWVSAGLPVVRGRKTMSLERQVRIVAGAMVLAGVGLGLTVHPAFLGLPAFVGAGLMFAGVTDWCGMALLLGRCPWNR